MLRRHLTTLAAGVLLAAAITGTARGDATEPPVVQNTPVPGPTAPPKQPVVAKARPNPADFDTRFGGSRAGAAVTIHGFKADGQGFGTLFWTLRNVSGTSLGPSDFAAPRASREIGPTGLSIVDGGQRHETLTDSDGDCLCYDAPPGLPYSSLEKGQDALLTNMFAIGPGATRITVEVPGFHPVPNVPVQR